MKIIRKIPKTEMMNNFPDLLGALNDPNNAMYCNFCDGLRLKKHQCYCIICHKKREICKKSDCSFSKYA